MNICPICEREHNSELYTCPCGYIRIKAYGESDRLFEIYKLSKSVFNGKTEWEDSPLSFKESDGTVTVLESLERERAISAVRPKTEKYVKTDCGILPFTPRVVSLILDVDETDSFLLDESNVRMLFIGKRLKRINGDGITMYSNVRYIAVDSESPCFSSDNNVLFDKSVKTLIGYARAKPESEYFIPSTVKRVLPRAFFHCDALKVIHASKKTVIEKNAVYPEGSVKVVYDLA